MVFLYLFFIILFVATGCTAHSIGYKRGRKAERVTWEDDMLPKMRRLTEEKDALWRSAVSKTQKLNRINRKFR